MQFIECVIANANPMASSLENCGLLCMHASDLIGLTFLLTLGVENQNS